MLIFQGKPHVEFNIHGQEKLVAPEEVSAEILKEIKGNAEVSHVQYFKIVIIKKTNNILPKFKVIRRFYDYTGLNVTDYF